MSRRLPTSAFRRSASSSIVCRNSRRASGVQSTSSWSRLVTDAFTAEIGVRRSWDTADSSAARSSLAAARVPGRPGFGLELTDLDRGRELLGERVEHALILAADRRAGEREHVLVVELDGPGARLGALRHAISARLPRSASRSPSGAARLRRRVRALAAGSRGRPTPATSRRGGAGPPPRRAPAALRCPARGERHEAADDDRDGEEHGDGEDVLALVDRERVERRHEVPVDEERSADRCGERRPEPADRRDGDDEQQEEEHHGRQPDVVSEQSEDPRQERRAPARRARTRSGRARRGSVAGRRVRGTTNASSERPPGWLTTWTSMPTPDSRMTRPITEPRVIRCQRERRLAPITICVTFSDRAASRSAAPTSAPTTSWYVPSSSLEELALSLEQGGGRARRGRPAG